MSREQGGAGRSAYLPHIFTVNRDFDNNFRLVLRPRIDLEGRVLALAVWEVFLVYVYEHNLTVSA